VTLGAFDDANGHPIGTPFMQASTLMHELGHNLELRHGGPPVDIGGTLQFQPNCKSNYLSIMNYLFQLRGLIDAGGVARIDWSRNVLPPLNKANLNEFAGAGTRPYRTSWFAPRVLGTIGFALDIQAAKKHCSGSELSTDEEAERIAGGGLVRIDGTALTGPIDWNVNGTLSNGVAQDINFSGPNSLAPTVLTGSNDWANIRLNQVGGRRNVGGSYLDEEDEEVIGPLSLDVGQGDLGQGDLGQGDLGQGDLGQGDLGQGDLGQGDLGQGDLGQQIDDGSGDLGRGDLGTGDLLLDPDTLEQSTGEPDAETAAAFGNTPPNNLVAIPKRKGIRLRWQAPNVGSPLSYEIWRVEGNKVTPTSVVSQVGTVYSPKLTLRDTNVGTGKTYTYWVIAVFPDGPDDDMELDRSDPSNFATAKKGSKDPDNDDHEDRD
jgi:hypothetical protein